MSGHKQPAQVPDYTGLNLQTASMTMPVPLCWGLTRVTPNLIYFTDFTAHKKSSKGGKGGGKTTVYDYTATLILALSEGPITTVTKSYIDNGVESGFVTAGFTLFTGTIPQTPWTYLSSAPNIAPSIYHASSQDAFGYQGIAYMAKANYDLGESEVVPQHSFEIEAPLWNTGYTGGGDADCALVVQDFLTNAEYGALFASAFLDLTQLLSGPNATTTGDGAYQTYCRAMGWGISPAIQSQEGASDILARWCQITNTAPVWTGYSLKLIPWGDATITGNGVTYVPATTSQFTFGDNEYLQDKDADPLECSLSDWFDASNAIALEARDRTQNYGTVPIDWIDQSQNELIGRRYASTVQAHEICDLDMAFEVVSLIGQRMVNIRETHTYKVGPEWSQLEPLDCGQITEAVLGMVDYPVRVRQMEEQDDGGFQIIVEEFPGTTGQPSGASTQGGIRGFNNNLIAPDAVNDPIIFEPSILAAQWLNKGQSVPILGILASGGSAGVNDSNWGGANVYLSSDGGTTYGLIGTIIAAGNQGVLTASLASYGSANPDTGHTLSVNLTESAGVLVSAAAAADAAAGVTLGIVQDGVCSTSFELIGPETATLTSAFHYDLTNLYRGLFGTTAGSHSSGALYGRLDNALFVFPLPAAYIGVALKIKLQSFNIFDQMPQDLSTCTVYTYTPNGAGFGGGTGGVPTTPTGFTATGGNVSAALAWSANPATDNVTGYLLYRAAGTGASFGSASLIATLGGSTLAYTDNGLAASTGFTYFLKAENVVGLSAATAGQDATTTAATFQTPTTTTATVDEAAGVTAGQIGYYFTSSAAAHVELANATDATKPPNCFFLAPFAHLATATVYLPGQWITGLTLTAGATYWLDTTAGAITTTQPSATGSAMWQLGVADETGTKLFFNPQFMGEN